jgi:CRISPR/Cas system-associated endoribonuclease Cas2
VKLYLFFFLISRDKKSVRKKKLKKIKKLKNLQRKMFFKSMSEQAFEHLKKIKKSVLFRSVNFLHFLITTPKCNFYFLLSISKW